MENLDFLLRELIRQPSETEWLEFKHDNFTPDTIGKDISALANSATLYERDRAYMVWGIEDQTHSVVGTKFNHMTVRQGKEELANYLQSMLSENADFEFYETALNDKRIVILVIEKAIGRPVTFAKVSYVRVGSYTKKLQDHRALESRLWDALQKRIFESQVAMADLELIEAVQRLSYDVYFELLKTPQPATTDAIAHYLLEDGLILHQDNGLYGITNLGAILFAKRLGDFNRLSRKEIRIIQYNGNNRLEMKREEVVKRGYVVGLEWLHSYLEALLPQEEPIEGMIRVKKNMYPSIALREAIANALIHQDFSATGAGPTIEVFEGRIEITNPGTPLVDILRIIDNPPRSRNEQLASMMRRMRVCDEAGTGWDKITIACELNQLPAPRIEIYENATRVILFKRTPFADLSNEDKLWACYLHACIKYVQNERATNQSLRERFGLDDKSAASVSRLIKLALEKKLIKPVDPQTGPRYMKYVPEWA